MSRYRIHVGVLEPSDLVFEGLCTLLQKAEHLFTVYRVPQPEELEALCGKEDVHVLVLNPLALLNRMHILQRLRVSFPGIPVVAMLSTLAGPDLLARVDATFTIGDDAATIVDTVHGAYSLCGCAVETPVQGRLSDREIDVLKMLASGRSNREIAAELNISIHTVVSHRKNISEKTGIKSLPGLTMYAISRKIVGIEGG